MNRLFLKYVITNGNMIPVLIWIEQNIFVKNVSCGEIVVGISKTVQKIENKNIKLIRYRTA